MGKFKRLDRTLVKLLKKSNKEIRTAIHNGNIKVNNIVEINHTCNIGTFCEIKMNNTVIYSKTAYYIMLHKPKGYVSATKDKEHPVVIDLFPKSESWVSELRLVGRLDRFTTGLMLLTNDGNWSKNISCPVTQAKKIPKRYLVTTLKDIVPFEKAVQDFHTGLYLPDNDLTCRSSILERVNGMEKMSSKKEGVEDGVDGVENGKSDEGKSDEGKSNEGTGDGGTGDGGTGDEGTGDEEPPAKRSKHVNKEKSIVTASVTSSSSSSAGLVTSSFLHQYYITLYEGKRHQVKCMINAISMNEEQDVRNRVVELHRESIGELKLDPLLKEGEWRFLLPKEIELLS